jgi:NADPH-dependent curcumin reductase CurA
LAIASLLMVPALLAFDLAAHFSRVALLSVLGLSEGDTLTEAGASGALAAVFLIALLAVPQVVGIVLGIKARRLGERRLGETGIVLNAAIGAYYMLTSGIPVVID